MVDEAWILRKLSEPDEYFKQIKEKDLKDCTRYKEAIVKFLKSASDQ